MRILQITLCFICLFRLPSDSARHTDHIVFRLFVSINIRQCASHRSHCVSINIRQCASYRSHCVSFVCFDYHQTLRVTQITLCFICLFRLTSDSARHTDHIVFRLTSDSARHTDHIVFRLTSDSVRPTDHIVFRLFVSINIRQCASYRSHCVSFVCFDYHQTLRVTQITLCFICLFRLTSDSARHTDHIVFRLTSDSVHPTDHIVFRLFVSINIRQCASHRSHCVSFVRGRNSLFVPSFPPIKSK